MVLERSLPEHIDAQRQEARMPHWLLPALWGFALVVASLHTWRARFLLTNLDAVSYLDIADAWRTGRWGDVLNGYWSPAYSWALAIAMSIVRPSPGNEYVLLHIVNLALFVVTTATFHLLLRELLRQMPHDAASAAFSPASYAILLFLLYVWFACTHFVVWAESPDLIPTAATLLGGALLVRLQRAPSLVTAALMGGVIGFGYLGKAAMLPAAPAFILAGAIAARRSWMRTALAATLALLAVAGPWVAALSVSRGRITFGDSGRINYLWQVNRSKDWPRNFPPHWPHWDNLGDHGRPVHPARRLHVRPAVYEFATPFTAATYPMWYSPDYWYEGISPRFSVVDQARRILLSGIDWVELLTLNRNDHDYFNPAPALFALLLVLWAGAPVPRVRWRPAWTLLLPATAIIVLYSLVRVAPRYVGAALLLGWMTLFASVRLAAGAQSRQLLRGVSIAGSTVLLAAITTFTVGENYAGWRRMLRGEPDELNLPWQTAMFLRDAGIVPGTPIGVIGNAQVASRWARLARVRIVAEVPVADLDAFLNADHEDVESVLSAFRSTPATALLAERLPRGSAWSAWRPVEGTPYSVIFLSSSGDTSSPR